MSGTIVAVARREGKGKGREGEGKGKGEGGGGLGVKRSCKNNLLGGEGGELASLLASWRREGEVGQVSVRLCVRERERDVRERLTSLSLLLE
jgi:hypothetical protein